jgi:hypothetical protein
MSKSVVLNLGSGSLDDGFTSVTVQILSENNQVINNYDGGQLPPEPEIYQLFQEWQSVYSGISGTRKIKAAEVGITNISVRDFEGISQQLQLKINDWLDSKSFRQLDKQIRNQLDYDEEVRIIINTNNKQLQRLPWHLWQLLEDFPKAEIAFSAPKASKVSSFDESRNKVNILAILGNDEGIDIKEDCLVLEQLLSANIHFLVKPQRKDINDTLWEKSWDILFFAGHSETENELGKIHINDTDSLTIKELKNALKKAVSKGLQLAIFNSCDGLGLAWELADLHIPQLIVMREPVPDKVAQEFLKYFLKGLADGVPFYLAFREARERLQGLEEQYPCASWLPVIWQNAAATPPTWSSFHHGELEDINEPINKPTGKPVVQHSVKVPVLIGCLVIAALVMGMRSLGVLSGLEQQQIAGNPPPGTTIPPTPDSSKNPPTGTNGTTTPPESNPSNPPNSTTIPPESKPPNPPPVISPPGVGVAIVFKPRSNVRAKPNGTILCYVETVSTIKIYGDPINGWYKTDVCGGMGYIYRTEIRF